MQKSKTMHNRWDSLIAGLTPMLLSEHRASVAIQKSLNLIQLTTSVCRVYIFDMREDEQHGYLCSQRYESCRDGVEPQIDNPDLQDIPMKPYYGRWVDNLQQNRPVVGLIREFPVSEQDLLEAQGIKSLLILPILENGQVIAMAGFDDTATDRIWDTDHIRILQDAVIMLGSLLVRERNELEMAVREQERESLLHKLMTEQSKLLGLTENVQEGLWIRDAVTFELLFVNKTTSRMFGLDLKAFSDEDGNRYLDYVHPEDRERVKQQNQNHFESKEEVFVEWRLLHALNSVRWVRAHLFTVNDPVTGRPTLHCGVLTDITEERERTEALKAAKKQADELNRLKSTILLSIRHEFRTPLTGILGFADLINMSTTDAEVRSYAQNISVSANRLHNTLDSLLDYATIDSGIQTSNPELISIKEIIADLVITLEYKTREKGVRLKMTSSGIDQIVYLDSQILYTVVRQLFDNAIKFTTDGEVGVHIEVKSNTLYLNVSDTGCGIPDSIIDQVFEPFRQGSEGTQRTHEGSGLGLPIVKRNLDLVNGVIRIEPNSPAGTMIKVEIPLSSMGTSDAGELTKEVVVGRILYVEDNAIMQLLVRETFHDVPIDIVGSAEEALPLLESNAYDLILLDINLGAGMNGIELCHLIRSKPEHQQRTIVAVTASSRAEIDPYLGPQGFSSIVYKPFNVKQLRDLAKTVLPD